MPFDAVAAPPYSKGGHHLSLCIAHERHDSQNRACPAWHQYEASTWRHEADFAAVVRGWYSATVADSDAEAVFEKTWLSTQTRQL